MKQITKRAEGILNTSSAEFKNEQLHLISVRLVNAFQLDELICISSQRKYVKTTSCFRASPSDTHIDE